MVLLSHYDCHQIKYGCNHCNDVFKENLTNEMKCNYEKTELALLFSRKKQNINQKNSLGLLHFQETNFNQSVNFFVDLEREDVDEFTFLESLQYVLGNLDLLYSNIDCFFNVSDKDLTFGALAFDYRIMLLIDSKNKENEVKKIAKELFWQWYDLKYPTERDDIQAIEKKHEKRKLVLTKKLLKYCVLK